MDSDLSMLRRRQGRIDGKVYRICLRFLDTGILLAEVARARILLGFSLFGCSLSLIPLHSVTSSSRDALPQNGHDISSSPLLHRMYEFHLLCNIYSASPFSCSTAGAPRLTVLVFFPSFHSTSGFPRILDLRSRAGPQVSHSRSFMLSVPRTRKFRVESPLEGYRSTPTLGLPRDRPGGG